jgi:hypothetical protein
MNYRLSTLLAAEAANTAGTKTIDINLAKPISRITVQMKGTNSTNVPVAHPAKMISKIEVVDGSSVLFGLSGIQCQALNFFESGRLPINLMNYITGVQCAATFEINFGRYLWDEVLAFDPSKFNNPQLKITHNLALGGSTPTSAELSVFAHVFDQKEAKPTGFLLSKEQYSYTLAASAKENIDLATDMPYRFLMLQSLTAAKQPWENFNKLKLSEDNDQHVIIADEKTSDLFKLWHDHPRILEQILAADLDAAPTIYCTPGYLIAVAALGLGAADTALFTAQGYGGAFAATGTNGASAQMNVTGISPHNALAIPMGQKDLITDFYDVSKIGDLRLTVTAGSGASGTCEICSQQMRTY